MNDIKKIVLFNDETSKDGGSWLIIRDSGYESVSLNEGKRICAEYAAMNGITTREMVNEQLLNKVVFYSSDFNSALRDYVFNNNNNDYKNVHAENNDIVSGENDNLSNDVYNKSAVKNGLIEEPFDDEYYMLAEDGEGVSEAGEKKPNQFVMVENPYVPVEGNDDLDSSESSEVSDSEILSREEGNVDNIPVEGAEEVVEIGEEKPSQFVMVGNPYVPVESNDDSNPSESSKVSNSEILSRIQDIVNNNSVEGAEEIVDAGEEKPNQFVKVGNPYVPVEGNDDLDSSKSSEVSDSEILSSEEDNVDNIPVEGTEEIVDAGEEKPSQFVKVGDPYVPVEANDDLDSSEYFAVIDNDDTNKDDDKEEVEEEPTSEEEDDDDDDEKIEEEPTREEDDKEIEEESTREEDDDDDEKIEEEPTREEDDDDNDKEVEEEPTREEDDDDNDEEVEEETTREEEDDDEEEIEEDPTSEDDEEEVSKEETTDEDIGIIDKIKEFGNSALEKLKKFTIFGTIVGMVVAGIVSIFGVKYSLNRDKDDIYVTHSSNTEEIPDDEYLFSSPLAKFVDGVINKFFPTNESVIDEENENEEILMGNDTDLEIDDNVSNNTDDNSDLPNEYVPYSSDREFYDNDVVEVAIADSDDETEYDNYDLAESDLVETSTNLDTAETIADNDINETNFIELTTNSDFYNDDGSSFEEAFLVNTEEVTNETYFANDTTDSDFYDIAVDSSEDAALINNKEGFDEIEFSDGYDADNTLNYTTDSSGDQTDLELLDPNYYSAYIDDYINSLESSDVSESGRQYVKVA